MNHSPKNLVKSLLSVTLVVTLAFNMPISHLKNVLAEEINETAIADETNLLSTGEPDNVAVETEEETALVGEIEEKREQNVKHFMREDGLVEAVYYPYSVHYKENDKWIDIDNTLVYNEDKEAYESNSNSFTTSFAKVATTDNLVSMKNGENELSWVIPEMDAAEIVIDNPGGNTDMRFNSKLFAKVTYKEAINGADVEYIVTPDGVKEYFVIESAEELENLEEITLVLKTQNLVASEIKEKVRFRNEAGQSKFALSQPVMFDAKGENVKAISFDITEIKQNDDIKKSDVSITEIPVSEALVTTTPVTETPMTTAPMTEMPVAETSMTEMPVVETPMTEVPMVKINETTETATEVPVLEEFLTEAPISEAYMSDISISETKIPVTEVPATEIPITEVPATEIPITEIPATQIPVTDTPSTDTPSTDTPDILSYKTAEYIDELSKTVAKANSNDRYYYTYTLNISEEIEDVEEITFPLIIDPDITSNTAKTNIDDSYISSVEPDVNFGYNERLKIGYGSDSGITRSYVKINTLPSITAGDLVVNGTLVMPRYMDENTEQAHVGYDKQLNLHKVTGSWSEGGVTWASPAPYESKITSAAFSKYYDVTTGTVSVNTFDITGLVREWYANSWTNYGVMIKTPNENSNAGYHEFASAEMKFYPELHPYLSVVYVNASGLEDSYSYHEQSVGRAGISYINDATGHMTLIHSDVETTDLQMSVSLFHSYNTSLYNTQSGYGKGFRISYDQTISAVTINSKKYYKYIDEDGTTHYFYQDSSNANIYYDERNKNNKLTISGSTATLNYGESHINKIFTNNKLSAIKDANGNTILIRRDTSSRVWQIIDASNNTTTLKYNSNNLLDIIVDPGNRETKFTYNASGYLTQITYPDGNSTTYTYNGSGYMSLAKNYDGYGMNYSYTGNPNRVTQVSESLNSSWYMYLMFKYGHLVTTVTDTYGETSHYRFNNFGQLISEQDNKGNAVYYDYEGSTPGKKDQLKVSSDLCKTAINELGNSSFENSGTGYWSISNTVANAATITRDTGKNITTGCLKISKTTSAASSYIYATNTVEVGETYDFSCYLKTGDIKSASIYIEYRDAAGNKYTTKKPIIANGTEWTKNYVSVEIPTNATGTIYSGIVVPSGSTGNIYMDDAQLTEGSGGEKTNLLKNGDFTKGSTGWQKSGTETTDTTVAYTTNNSYKPANLDDTVFKLTGSLNSSKKVYQIVNASGSKGDTYVLGGFAKTDAIPTFKHTNNGTTAATTYGRVVLRLEFQNGSTTVTTVDKEFAYDTFDWQYLSFYATAEASFTRILVSIIYSKNLNSGYFDGFSLYKDGFGYNYEYSQDDNDLTKVTTKEGETLQYTYDDNHNLISSKNKYSDVTEYDYDNKHNLTSVTYFDKKTTEYVPDSKGNIKSTKTYDSSKSNYYLSESTYVNGKNLKDSDTDARGNTVNYNYNVEGLLESVTDSKTSLKYFYNEMRQLEEVNDDISYVNYIYDGDRLSSIVLSENETGRLLYTFGYNSFGQMLNANVSGKRLITNTYHTYKKYLTSSTYGNGYVRNYVYDDRDLLVAEKEGSVEIYRNYYSSDGSLYQKRDNLTASTIHYDYDEQDRIKRVLDDKDVGLDHSITYTYNNKDLLSLTERKYGSTSWNETHTYTASHEPDVSTSSLGASVDYNYDGLGRVNSKSLDSGIHFNYGYVDGASEGSTTGLTGFFSYSTSNQTQDLVLYQYDETGLMTLDKGLRHEIRYTYDSKSQLTSAWNITKTEETKYEYDAGGNITKKIIRYRDSNSFYVKDTIEYTYDDTWPDLLVSYDGKSINYDAIGNPTKYLDYSSLTWNGRQLTNIANNGVTLADYKYNSDGIRTTKTTDDGTVEYIYTNGQLSAMKLVGGLTIYFSYDANGDIMSVNYLGLNYYYVRNPQGDVIALYDEDGEVVEKYTYDPWGKPTSEPTSYIGKNQPFRYRGYIYDEETGFYYVSSRYYDPETGRWLNADSKLPSVGGDVLGNNMFAYCMNNPVNMTDPTGNWPKLLKEIGSRLKHTIKTMYKTAVAPLKALKIGIASGPGVGFKGKVKVKGISGEVSALYAQTDSAVLENGKLDFRNNTTKSIGFSAERIVNFTHFEEISHSYLDSKCTCNVWEDTFGEKQKCPASIQSVGNEMLLDTWEISAGVFLGFGLEVIFGVDLKTWNDELIDIFNEGLEYKGYGE